MTTLTDNTAAPALAGKAPGPKAGKLWWTIATFLCAGKLRPGPGTWGSLGALAVWGGVASLVPPAWHPAAALAGAAAATAIGIPAAARVSRELGNDDPSCVVIDEVAGQLLALADSSLHWKSLLTAFILFRAFDILKPPPLRRLEKFPGGAGIMLDDLGAGLYALAVMQLLRHFGVLG
ncbi:MAG: phosphatidylglycerophosphatase A [Terriglobales bacterium]